MKNSKVLKGILLILGLVLIVLGTWRVTNPINFYANSGILLGNDVRMLNEVRAAGGVVVSFGILIILGAFIARLAYTSTLVSIVLFLSFGFTRLLSIAIDGDPGEKIVQGIIFEFIFGLLGVFAFFKYREH